jgi:hypothetical protein
LNEGLKHAILKELRSALKNRVYPTQEYGNRWSTIHMHQGYNFMFVLELLDDGFFEDLIEHLYLIFFTVAHTKTGR